MGIKRAKERFKMAMLPIHTPIPRFPLVEFVLGLFEKEEEQEEKKEKERGKTLRRGLVVLLLCGGLSSPVYGHEEHDIRADLRQCNVDYMALLSAAQELKALNAKEIALKEQSIATLEKGMRICEETMPRCLELKEQLGVCLAGKR